MVNFRTSCHAFSLICDLVDDLDPLIFGDKAINDLTVALFPLRESLKSYFEQVILKSKK